MSDRLLDLLADLLIAVGGWIAVRAFEWFAAVKDAT